MNFLDASHSDLALRFADPARTDDRFAIGCWREGKSKVPILRDSPISLECEIMGSFEARSHRVLACEISHVHGDKAPGLLLYANQAFGRFESI